MMSGARSSFQTPMTIKETVTEIGENHYFLPAIQREFVWNHEQIARLFDSIMKGYPIGSFLFWNVKEENVATFDFYKFMEKYHERDYYNNPKAELDGVKNIGCVLDGQQRLTSLYIGLRGTYAEKLPRRRWDDPNAYPEKRLYLNLLSRAPLNGNDEDLYDFKFLTEKEATHRDEKTYWFRVGEVLNFTKEADVNRYLIKNKLMSLEEEKSDFANETLFDLFSKVHNERIISYYLEVSQDIDTVLNIFIRVNSGGTVLSNSDLLLSIATAKWSQIDARKEIFDLVKNVNKTGDRFNFNNDFVLKSFLVLSDIKNIAFKVSNFTNENMELMENKWEIVSKSIRLSVELLDSWGYNWQTLTSNNAVIPIAYYLSKIGNPDNFVLSSTYKKDRERIKRWLTLSLVKRVFSGQPDNVLRSIRELITDGVSEFPLEEIIDQFKGSNKTLIIQEEDVDKLLEIEYSNPQTFSILALLYPNLDYRNKFHIDHIFPQKFFKDKELSKRSIPKGEWEDFAINQDYIANLQLLEGILNEEKSSQDFDNWLIQNFPDESRRNEYKLKNYIPLDFDLKFKNFLDFIDEREELIRSKLMEILGVKETSKENSNLF